jgi:hypothetical protein
MDSMHRSRLLLLLVLAGLVAACVPAGSSAQYLSGKTSIAAATGWDMPFGTDGLVGGTINDLLVHGGDLVAGGAFKIRGQVETHRVARWDGSSWTVVGAAPDAPVMVMCVYRDELIIGGRFTAAGDTALSYIARWDGEHWQPLGAGTSGPVLALAVHDDMLAVGGSFTHAGGVYVGRLARWDGERWLDMGDDYTRGVAEVEDDLVSANPITALASVRGTLVAADGSLVYSWTDGRLERQQLDTRSRINALTEYGDALIVGGGWSRVRGQHSPGLMTWFGASIPLEPFIAGVDYQAGDRRRKPMIHDMVAHGNELYVTGVFTRAGGDEARFIAAWNGVSWMALGAGLNQHGNALVIYDGDLVVGGEFSQAGGAPASLIARWRLASH